MAYAIVTEGTLVSPRACRWQVPDREAAFRYAREASKSVTSAIIVHGPRACWRFRNGRME